MPTIPLQEFLDETSSPEEQVQIQMELNLPPYTYYIEWDTEGDEEVAKKLPQRVVIPEEIHLKGINPVIDYLFAEFGGWLVTSMTRLS